MNSRLKNLIKNIIKKIPYVVFGVLVGILILVIWYWDPVIYRFTHWCELYPQSVSDCRQ